MKRFRRIFLSFLMLLIVIFATTGIYIWNYGKKDECNPADAAIVLGAAIEDNKPTPVFRERINHGIYLYQNGFADYLIFTGGIGENDSLSEAFVAKQYAMEMGVPEADIFIEEISLITEQNMEQAKLIMDEHNLETAIIVSDPLHMCRAMRMANDYGIAAISSPTPTTMYRSFSTQLPFLAREVVLYIGYGFISLF